MVFRPPPRRSGRWAVASVAVLSLGLGSAVPAQAAAPKPEAGQNKVRLDQRVTLVTGDRVTLVGGDSRGLSIQPGPGRGKIAFNAYRVKGHLYVVPADVAAQLSDGKLDRRLFDVTGLVEAGYDDKASSVIPLLVTYSGKGRRAAVAGATVSRELPVVNGAAVKLAKENAGTFLRRNRSAGVEKIWLDGRRKPTLDQSVPQIGAPAAWQSGYTGKGVSVAVLDTGIDATHPDLSTQVAAAKNFTVDPEGDQVGHGTHVASTIAGTGAAQAGRYKGVAPDAKLYDGKVCEQDGCPESAILAGLDWAAKEVKAKVVNISLGGADTPELDPVEEAVNRLTAETGTLFVIAAGNSGPGAGTVDSPGSAEAALTVGAVDRSDQLADFSSRGPRTGDDGLKPDVTAPGVDIVAAGSKDASIGDPVGSKYVRLSGTSMATPHTAGAAALLAQQHPGWKAGDLKATLMASAKPIDGQSTFEQGAGRIDAAKATKQTVVSDPGGVPFGTAQWPHDDDAPVTKTVTYRNLGDQPVTLDLTVTMTGPDGKPAPADALKLSASTVTVPAGGTSTVDVISSTRHDGPAGTYSGRITASAGGAAVTTPLAVDKEVESYTLTIDQVGMDGKPAAGDGILYGITVPLFDFFGDPSGTVKVRLPKGEYLVDGTQVVELSEEELKVYKLVRPTLSLTSDTRLVLDARTTKPIKVTVPQADAVEAIAITGYQRLTEHGELSAVSMVDSLADVQTAHVGPPVGDGQFTGNVTSQWVKRSGERFDNSPYLYGLVDTMPGSYPTGFTRNVRVEELAVVKQGFSANKERAYSFALGFKPGIGLAGTPGIWFDLPAERRLLVDAEPVSWESMLTEVVPGDPYPEDVTRVASGAIEYQAGRTVKERFNAAVLAPAPGWGFREADLLSVGIAPTSDADGHFGGTVTDSAATKLYRNGEQVAESRYFGEAEVGGLPAEEAEYKLVTSMTRPSISKLSPRIDYAWTFRSGATEAETSLPVVSLRYQPKVDARNVARRTPVTVLPVTVLAQPLAEVPKLRTAELWVSGDSGKSWKPGALVSAGQGRYQAVFRTPVGSTVSLKAKLVDEAGNVTEQTVVDGYHLK